MLQACGITHVVDLSNTPYQRHCSHALPCSFSLFSLSPSSLYQPASSRRAGFSYHVIRIDDSSTASLLEHLPGAFAFIQQALQRQQGVLVHCYAGISYFKPNSLFSPSLLVRGDSCSVVNSFLLVDSRLLTISLRRKSKRHPCTRIPAPANQPLSRRPSASPAAPSRQPPACATQPWVHADASATGRSFCNNWKRNSC